MMLKLPPPSPTVTGILSQRGCWDQLGSHGDFSFSGGSGRAKGRRHGWIAVPCGAAGGDQRQEHCRAALLQAQPQATLVHLMQFSALQHAVPVPGWHKGLCGQAGNRISQPNLMEITLGGNYKHFLLELSPWFSLACGTHTCACRARRAGEQPAVKAAGSFSRAAIQDLIITLGLCFLNSK